jgi:hypothetical protein
VTLIVGIIVGILDTPLFFNRVSQYKLRLLLGFEKLVRNNSIPKYGGDLWLLV